MARKKDTPQKAALREMMSNYLKENNVKVKDGTDVNSIIDSIDALIFPALIVLYSSTAVVRHENLSNPSKVLICG